MIFLLISISLATKIVEYRFGYNFGEVFHDFSGNGRDAVNGDSSTTLTSNTISTDRGAYFGTGSYKITLPLNDQVQSSFVLPNSFLIASWIFGFDAYGTLYSRYKDSANQFYVNLNDAFDKYVGRVIIQAIDTGELMTSAYGFTISNF